jgi:hypothetical protein
VGKEMVRKRKVIHVANQWDSFPISSSGSLQHLFDFLYYQSRSDRAQREFMHPPYLMQHLSCIVGNIHQYTSICTHKIYTPRIFSSCIFETLGAKRSQNQPVSAWNLTRLIPHSSRALSSWDPTNTICILSENQFSAWFPSNKVTRHALKDRIV